MHAMPISVSWPAAVLGAVCGLAAGCGGTDVPRPTEPVSVGPIDLTAGPDVGGAPRFLAKADGPRFSGIAWTMIRGMSCSGAFVVPSAAAPPASAPAYVLTAGHCVRNPLYEANEVEAGTDISAAQATVVFRYFDDSRDAATTARVRALAFGTMKGKDIGIVELEPTCGQLRAQGVVPFVLSPRPSDGGEGIAVVGLPFLNPVSLAACHATRRVPLVLEGVYHWFDHEANDCQGIVGGSSGTPVFSLATGEVLAVVNTLATPLAGYLPCVEDHPCEVGDGITYAEGSAYASGISGLAGCFDATGRFDRELPACPLDRGVGLQPTPGSVALSVGAPPVTVALASAGASDYRFASGPAGTIDCRDAAAYGPVTDWATAPTLSVAAAAAPGVSLLCLQAGVGTDPTGAWQDLAAPTVVTVRTWSAD